MYNQGDILLIPIPFSDLTSSKKRPVLVLSNLEYNYKTEDLIVSAVTSNLCKKDYCVSFGTNDMAEGNLEVDSLIRADKLYTLSNKIVIKKFGRVKPEIVEQVKEKIIDLLN